MPVEEARRILGEPRTHGAPVIGGAGRLVGIVTVSNLTRFHEPGASVGAIMTPRPVTVTAATPVSTAIHRMATLGIGRLPVVADDDATRGIGLFRREDAVTAYHEALGSSTTTELARRRLRLRTSPDVHYFEFLVPPGSVTDV